jgi:hypothetical protein
MFPTSLVSADLAQQASDLTLKDWLPTFGGVATLLAVVLGWWLTRVAARRQERGQQIKAAITQTALTLDALSLIGLITETAPSADRLTAIQQPNFMMETRQALAVLRITGPNKVRDIADLLDRDLLSVLTDTIQWYKAVVGATAIPNDLKLRIGNSTERVRQLTASLANDAKPPVVRKLKPAGGPTNGGTQVKIRGKHFRPRSRLRIYFGPAQAEVKKVGRMGRSIVVFSPSGVTSQTVRVELTPPLRRDADVFVYQPETTIAAVPPPSLPDTQGDQAKPKTAS